MTRAFLVTCRNEARRTARLALAGTSALLLLASCDSVLGLREGYYLSAATAGVGGDGFGGELGGASDIGGSNAIGGTFEANGGGGIGGMTSSGGASSGAPTTAGVGGGGASPVGEAGASSGGAPDMPLCAAHPTTAESGWVPTASPTDAKYPPSAATDGASTRWSTGLPQAGNEWLQIDFGAPVSIRRINLQQGVTYSNDYPRMYAVVVSDKSKDLTGTVLTSGVGTSGVTTTIVLPQVAVGRYLLIEQLDTSLSWWSVEEVEVSCYDD